MNIEESMASIADDLPDGWTVEDCSLCVSGIETCVDGPPIECEQCQGKGYLFITPKRRIADYPGGPLRGMA